MKLKLTLITLLISLFANANFEKASILFNDGHTESGFIKSFLEYKIIDLSLSNSLEHDLNLDDKTIKFKTSEEGEVKSISIDEINELTLLYENGGGTTFKVLFLKDISNSGEIKDSGRKVFLPYVKKGKINIFGVKFKQIGKAISGPFKTDGMRFYYQNEKENYAINYQDIGMLSLMNLKSRIINPFKDLFKDCPSLMAKLNATSEEKLQFFKMDKESKDKLKEFKKMDRNERGKLEVYHHHNFYSIEKMMKEYEECK
jgi:hypothetical protein